MIIPRPKKTLYSEKCLDFDRIDMLCADDERGFAAKYIRMFCGFYIGYVNTEKDANLILKKNKLFEDNEYVINVSDKIIVEYGDAEGLRNALATLIQLIKYNNDIDTFSIGYQLISDYSDCKYRGVMIDLARGLPCFERLKEDIKRLSLAKCNYLHLHLTDSKGICYESSVFNGSDINGTKRYTADMLKELAEWCKSLGIEIIPEIEIPAHAHYLQRTHPEFMCKCNIENQSTWCVCAANDKVYDFFGELIGELCGIFDGEYIHVGGDELCFNDFPQWNEFCHWDICEVCQERMEENNIITKTELYYLLMNKMNEIIKGFGKKMIMWNDQIDVSKPVGLSKDITVEFWRIANENRGPRKGCSFNALLSHGFNVINGNFERSYIDCEEFANPERMSAYSYLDYPKNINSENIIGSEVLAWEYGNPEKIFYEASFAPCAILALDKMWDCSDAVYNDEYKKALTKLIIGFETPDDYDMFEVFGSIMPPRKNETPTYVTIKNDMIDKETLDWHLKKAEAICETYSPIYIDRFKQIIRREMEIG